MENLINLGKNEDNCQGKPNLLLGLSGSVAAVKWIELALELSEHYTIKIVTTTPSGHFVRISREYCKKYHPEILARFENHFIVCEDAEILDVFGAKSTSSAADKVVLPIYSDAHEWMQYNEVKKDRVLHIDLRDWAHMMLVAPLSANSLACIANGQAGNLLTSIIRAWPFNDIGKIDKPILLAPAMNTSMWLHPITQEHLLKLRQDWGFSVMQPIPKLLACGVYGHGAMPEPKDIVVSAVQCYNKSKEPPTFLLRWIRSTRYFNSQLWVLLYKVFAALMILYSEVFRLLSYFYSQSGFLSGCFLTLGTLLRFARNKGHSNAIAPATPPLPLLEKGKGKNPIVQGDALASGISPPSLPLAGFPSSTVDASAASTISAVVAAATVATAVESVAASQSDTPRSVLYLRKPGKRASDVAAPDTPMNLEHATYPLIHVSPFPFPESVLIDGVRDKRDWPDRKTPAGEGDKETRGSIPYLKHEIWQTKGEFEEEGEDEEENEAYTRANRFEEKIGERSGYTSNSAMGAGEGTMDDVGQKFVQDAARRVVDRSGERLGVLTPLTAIQSSSSEASVLERLKSTTDSSSHSQSPYIALPSCSCSFCPSSMSTPGMHSLVYPNLPSAQQSSDTTFASNYTSAIASGTYENATTTSTTSDVLSAASSAVSTATSSASPALPSGSLAASIASSATSYAWPTSPAYDLPENEPLRYPTTPVRPTSTTNSCKTTSGFTDSVLGMTPNFREALSYIRPDTTPVSATSALTATCRNLRPIATCDAPAPDSPPMDSTPDTTLHTNYGNDIPQSPPSSDSQDRVSPSSYTPGPRHGPTTDRNVRRNTSASSTHTNASDESAITHSTSRSSNLTSGEYSSLSPSPSSNLQSILQRELQKEALKDLRKDQSEHSRHPSVHFAPEALAFGREEHTPMRHSPKQSPRKSPRPSQQFVQPQSLRPIHDNINQHPSNHSRSSLVYSPLMHSPLAKPSILPERVPDTSPEALSAPNDRSPTVRVAAAYVSNSNGSSSPYSPHYYPNTTGLHPLVEQMPHLIHFPLWSSSPYPIPVSTPQSLPLRSVSQQCLSRQRYTHLGQHPPSTNERLGTDERKYSSPSFLLSTTSSSTSTPYLSSSPFLSASPYTRYTLHSPRSPSSSVGSQSPHTPGTPASFTSTSVTSSVGGCSNPECKRLRRHEKHLFRRRFPSTEYPHLPYVHSQQHPWQDHNNGYSNGDGDVASSLHDVPTMKLRRSLSEEPLGRRTGIWKRLVGKPGSRGAESPIRTGFLRRDSSEVGLFCREDMMERDRRNRERYEEGIWSRTERELDGTKADTNGEDEEDKHHVSHSSGTTDLTDASHFTGLSGFSDIVGLSYLLRKLGMNTLFRKMSIGSRSANDTASVLGSVASSGSLHSHMHSLPHVHSRMHSHKRKHMRTVTEDELSSQYTGWSSSAQSFEELSSPLESSRLSHDILEDSQDALSRVFSSSAADSFSISQLPFLHSSKHSGASSTSKATRTLSASSVARQKRDDSSPLPSSVPSQSPRTMTMTAAQKNGQNIASDSQEPPLHDDVSSMYASKGLHINANLDAGSTDPNAMSNAISSTTAIEDLYQAMSGLDKATRLTSALLSDNPSAVEMMPQRGADNQQTPSSSKKSASMMQDTKSVSPVTTVHKPRQKSLQCGNIVQHSLESLTGLAKLSDWYENIFEKSIHYFHRRDGLFLLFLLSIVLIPILFFCFEAYFGGL